MELDKKKKQHWHRPGARINVYFSDLNRLRKLDRHALRHNRTRAEQIMRMVDEL